MDSSGILTAQVTKLDAEERQLSSAIRLILETRDVETVTETGTAAV
jgi:hypothetical protein